MADEIPDNPWRPITDADKSSPMLELFCPGMCPPTKGVLQGCWNARLKNWIYNPFGSTSFTTLFPSRCRDIEPPPEV